MGRRTFVLWMTDSGTMGLICSSRSDSMAMFMRAKARGLVCFLVSWLEKWVREE